jgi:hypothetical protein
MAARGWFTTREDNTFQLVDEKVRDGEDTIASTRDARAPQNLRPARPPLQKNASIQRGGYNITLPVAVDLWAMY